MILSGRLYMIALKRLDWAGYAAPVVLMVTSHRRQSSLAFLCRDARGVLRREPGLGLWQPSAYFWRCPLPMRNLSHVPSFLGSSRSYIDSWCVSYFSCFETKSPTNTAWGRKGVCGSRCSSSYGRSHTVFAVRRQREGNSGTTPTPFIFHPGPQTTE